MSSMVRVSNKIQNTSSMPHACDISLKTYVEFVQEKFE